MGTAAIIIDVQPVEFDEQLERFAALQGRHDTLEASSAAEYRAWHELHADRHRMWIATVDGRDAGLAHVDWRTWDPAASAPNVVVLVDPERRRIGVGTALFRAVSSWVQAHPDMPEEIRVEASEADRDGIAYWERRGFVEVERLRFVELQLDGRTAPSVELPQGLAVVTLADRPDLIRSVYDLMDEARLDIPGEHELGIQPFDLWRRQLESPPSYRPDANFLIVAGDDQVVGWASIEMSGAMAGTAFHGMTATARSWRGRGLARALKSATIAWAQSEGLTRLLAANEARNAAMRHINLSLGYAPAPDRIVLRGPIALNETTTEEEQ